MTMFLRRLLCSHRATTAVRGEWGEAWKCDVCGLSRVHWAPPHSEAIRRVQRGESQDGCPLCDAAKMNDLAPVITRERRWRWRVDLPSQHGGFGTYDYFLTGWGARRSARRERGEAV